MNSPKITIIVPIYNTFQYLERCLKSIRNQRFSDFEVILINDGSTDNSVFFCEEFIKIDNRFILKSKENGGLSSARNYGLKFAKGTYIAFVDSDDSINEYYCEILYELAISNNLDLLNFGLTYVKENKEEKRVSEFPKNKLIVKSEFLEILKQSSQNKVLWFACTNFYKNEFLKRENIIFDEKILLGEDSIFNLQCFSKAERIYSISNSLYYYIYNPTSLTQISFKPNLLEKFESQFKARIAIHEEDESINLKEYYCDIACNYLESSLFMLFSNLRSFSNKNKELELKKIRTSSLYNFSFENYVPSNSISSMMKLKIYLFKHRIFNVLTFLLK